MNNSKKNKSLNKNSKEKQTKAQKSLQTKNNSKIIKRKEYLKNNDFAIYLILIFIVVQVIGLLTAGYYSSFQDLRIALITDNPDDIINAVFIVLQILVFTGIILLIKRFSSKTGYIKFFQYFALFMGSVIVLDVFLSYIFALYISVCFLFTKYILEKYQQKNKKLVFWYNNFLLGISIAGAGSIIGLSLGIIPVLSFLILLSIYDIIAVFYTKHMITLADTFSKKNMSFIFYIPTKKRTYKLGSGDLVIPLIMSACFYFFLISRTTLTITLLSIFSLWIVALLGLFLTFYILKVKKLKAMPALPLQALFMVLLVIFVITFVI